MKILQINSVCGFGSTGNIVIDIAKMVMEQGHDALIAYGRNGKEHLGIKTLRIGNDYDVYLHGLYTRLMDKTGFASTKATVKFIEDIKHYKPDIIHLHNIHYGIGLRDSGIGMAALESGNPAQGDVEGVQEARSGGVVGIGSDHYSDRGPVHPCGGFPSYLSFI